jgi:hypothetical protein
VINTLKSDSGFDLLPEIRFLVSLTGFVTDGLGLALGFAVAVALGVGVTDTVELDPPPLFITGGFGSTGN